MRRTSLHLLDDIKEAIGKIDEYATGLSFEQFLADRRTQDAVVRNFEIIGEATKNLPDDLKNRYPVINWKRITGLRDVMAHGYYRVDYEVLWEVIMNHLPAFKKDITKIIREETRREKR